MLRSTVKIYQQLKSYKEKVQFYNDGIGMDGMGSYRISNGYRKRDYAMSTVLMLLMSLSQRVDAALNNTNSTLTPANQTTPPVSNVNLALGLSMAAAFVGIVIVFATAPTIKERCNQAGTENHDIESQSSSSETHKPTEIQSSNTEKSSMVESSTTEKSDNTEISSVVIKSADKSESSSKEEASPSKLAPRVMR